MVKSKVDPKINEAMKESMVARGVDDGDGAPSQAPHEVVADAGQSEVGFQNQAQVDPVSVSTPIKAKLHELQENIRGGLRLVKDEVAERLHSAHVSVKDGIYSTQTKVKKGFYAAEGEVKANPYAFAFAALGVGFIFGRILMSRRQSALKYDIRKFKDSSRQHTGVHIRR